MKTRRTLYLVIGVFLIAINLAVDFINFFEDRDANSDNIGYFIGSNILLVFGLILLRMSYRLNQKLIKEDDPLNKSIEDIGRT